MPRVRGAEIPQRVSSRGPAPLRTSSSDSDPLHHRSLTDRSPKLGDRRSPRNAHSEPVNQKKLGTRIAGLESQLEQAQGELKILKDQLASAEAAKKEAQKELEKKAPVLVQDKLSSPSETEGSNKKEMTNEQEIAEENQKETDVFEVPVEKVSLEFCQPCGDQEELKNKPVNIDPSFEEELAVKNEEINGFKARIEEKEKELEAFGQENMGLKHQLNEASLEISSAKAREEKTSLKLSQLEQELGKSQNERIQLAEKLKEVEGAKEALETEMKRLRIQTEQWRKAADAAAAVLSGGVEVNEARRISERCGSMDKQFGEPPAVAVGGGYGGFVGSPPGMGDDCDDGFGGGGKRKGSGMRMFGDLWKKKGQK